jgi:hypothetical protein
MRRKGRAPINRSLLVKSFAAAPPCAAKGKAPINRSLLVKSNPASASSRAESRDKNAPSPLNQTASNLRRSRAKPSDRHKAWRQTLNPKHTRRKNLIQPNNTLSQPLLEIIPRNRLELAPRRNNTIRHRIPRKIRHRPRIQQPSRHIRLQLRITFPPLHLFCPRKHLAQTLRHPRIFLQHRPPHNKRMVNRKKPGLRIIPPSLSLRIRKQRPNITPRAKVDTATVDQIRRRQVQHRSVKLPIDQHLPNVRRPRHITHLNSRRRRKPRRATVTRFRRPLHVPNIILRLHPELVRKNPTAPNGPRLLILRNPNALTAQVRRRRNPCAITNDHRRMKKPPRGKHGQRNPIRRPVGRSNNERRDRHLRNVELRKLQLPPIHFRRVQRRR